MNALKEEINPGKQYMHMDYWPNIKVVEYEIGRSFFGMFMDEDPEKKEHCLYSAFLTEQAWSVKDLLYGFLGNFSCGI